MSRLRYALVGVAAAATSGGYLYLSNDNDFQRALLLYKNLGPVITHYRIIELKHKLLRPTSDQHAQEDWDALHDKYSDHVMSTLRDLRGFYIKVGQMLANRGDDLPSIYIEKLRQLEDAVPHLLDETQVQDKICKELNIKSISEVFSHFNPTPIGSASIGQVHYGILKGPQKQEVAVKVQSPGVEELFRKDVKVARDFCRVFAPEQVIIFDEIERQFLTEFDYTVEAERLQIVKDNMKTFSNLVVVPQPFKQYSSKEVLTMEYLKGPKLVDGAREKGKEWAELNGTTLEELERSMKAAYDRDGLPPPYNGPGPLAFEMYRRLLMTKDAVLNTPLWVANNFIVRPARWSLGGVGLKSFAESKALGDFKYFKSFIPLNSARIMDTLLKVHGTQLLVNGFFNADPHPGNFLMLSDGRIGLIDYGQVKSLEQKHRLAVAELIVALANKDVERACKVSYDTGYRSKYNNKEVIYNMLTIALDQDGRQVTHGLNIQQFMDTQFAKDPWKTTNPFVVMPMRMSLLIRGIGIMLQNPVSTAAAWKKIAEDVIKKEGGIYDKDGNVSGLSGQIFDGLLDEQIGTLTSLEQLDIQKTDMSGPLPQSLGNLRRLKLLVLSENKFNGTIPDTIGQLTLLETLRLSNNFFVGTIPTTIASSMSALRTLSLDSNHISGMIPDTVAELSILRVLELQNNRITMVPESLGTMRSLEALYLQRNMIYGPLPRSLSRLASLKIFDASANQLMGDLPAFVSELVEFNVVDNCLTGNAPANFALSRSFTKGVYEALAARTDQAAAGPASHHASRSSEQAPPYLPDKQNAVPTIAVSMTSFQLGTDPYAAGISSRDGLSRPHVNPKRSPGSTAESEASFVSSNLSEKNAESNTLSSGRPRMVRSPYGSVASGGTTGRSFSSDSSGGVPHPIEADLPADPEKWSIQNVSIWLLLNNFDARTIQMFKENEISGQALLGIDMEILAEMQLSLGVRVALIRCIDNLRNSAGSPGSEAGSETSRHPTRLFTNLGRRLTTDLPPPAYSESTGVSESAESRTSGVTSDVVSSPTRI
ncbi:hypothetical protein HDV05_006030 [Chytridiales sp. JEL 0842]|nr:hypothetical protein HDV05_006030 [Chytridiales sp. JEL 0842]